MHCCIRIKGHLDSSWQTWLDNLEMVHEVEGTTQLRGQLPDQAALYGMLLTIRRLGLTLLSLESSESPQDEEPLWATSTRQRSMASWRKCAAWA